MIDQLRHPVRAVPLAVAADITIGTLLLSLPVSRTGGADPDPLAAAFTAVSATCVTGLTVVDTATYWSPFGQVVIMLLIQIGGLGVMSLATLLALLVFGRVDVRGALVAQAEGSIGAMGDVAQSLRSITLAVFAMEAVVAVVLTLRFALGYGYSWGRSVWEGVFHSISAFNNAGFALYTDNLIGFQADAVIIPVLCAAIIAGGLGFPVYYELLRQRPGLRRLSLHAKLTLIGYLGLTLISISAFFVSERHNPGTIGGLDTQGQMLGALMGGVTPRTAGFNSIDYAQVRPETMLLDTIMMFIGGGSAGTAGGIKVTTFLILLFAIWAQMRGEPQVVVGGRAIPHEAVQEALTVALLAVAAVVAGTLALLFVSSHPMDRVLFEVASAFGTTGLSTGITASFDARGEWVLMVLMFIGRIGPVTAASALALGSTRRYYRLAEERPIVG